MDNQEQEQEQLNRKKLTCPLCRCTFPNQDFYDSHQIIEAKQIVNMLDEEFPTFNDTMAKIDEIKRDVKNMERESEFIKETMQRETKFREEQQQHEIEFRKGIEQRELKNKRIIEELTSIFAEGKTPDTIRLFRALSVD